MIESAEEFVRLRTSENIDEYSRAVKVEAPIEVWNEVIENYPDMSFWVAQNKTVPYEILELLADHGDDRVRSMVAMKNKLKEPLLLKLASDPSDSVRANIARHKRATLAVLNLLSVDVWAEVAKMASERIKNGSYK